MIERRRGLNARIVASLAILAALVAIALEIAYAVGHFVLGTFQQYP